MTNILTLRYLSRYIISRMHIFTFLVFVSASVSVVTSMSIVEHPIEFFMLSDVYAAKAKANPDGPIINDPNLVAQVVYKGLREPTAMAFLDSQ